MKISTSHLLLLVTLSTLSTLSMSRPPEIPSALLWSLEPGKFNIKDQAGNTAEITIFRFFSPKIVDDNNGVERVFMSAEVVESSNSSLFPIGDVFLQVFVLGSPSTGREIVFQLLGGNGDKLVLGASGIADINLLRGPTAIAPDKSFVVTPFTTPFVEGKSDSHVGAFSLDLMALNAAFCGSRLFSPWGIYPRPSDNLIGCTEQRPNESLSVNLYSQSNRTDEPFASLFTTKSGLNLALIYQPDGTTSEANITDIRSHNYVKSGMAINFGLSTQPDGTTGMANSTGAAFGIGILGLSTQEECIASVSLEDRFADNPQPPAAVCEFELEANSLGLTTAKLATTTLFASRGAATGCSSSGVCISHCIAIDALQTPFKGSCLLHLNLPLNSTDDVTASLLTDEADKLIFNFDQSIKPPAIGTAIGLVPGTTDFFKQKLFAVNLATGESTAWFAAGEDIQTDNGATTINCLLFGDVSLSEKDSFAVECLNPVLDGQQIAGNVILIGQGLDVTLDPTPECSGSQVVIPATVYEDGDDIYCVGDLSLTTTSGETVRVKNGSKVRFKSQHISLKPPFNVEAGGRFTAVLP